MKAVEHEDFWVYERLHKLQGEMISDSSYGENYYTLLGLKQTVSLYLMALSKLRVINNIDWGKADRSFIKAVLNTNSIKNKHYAERLAIASIKEKELTLFKELDKQENPYYILLCPTFKYMNIYDEKRHGWVKSHGVTDLALEACERYFKHELKSIYEC